MSDRKDELAAEDDGLFEAFSVIEGLIDAHVAAAHGGDDSEPCARCDELEARSEALVDEMRARQARRDRESL